MTCAPDNLLKSWLPPHLSNICWLNEVQVLQHVIWLKPTPPSVCAPLPLPVQSTFNLLLRYPFSSSVSPPLRSREVGPHVNSQWTASGLTSFFCFSLAETLENFSGHVLLIPLSFPPLPLFLILHYCLSPWSYLGLVMYIWTFINIMEMFWFWTYPVQTSGV